MAFLPPAISAVRAAGRLAPMPPVAAPIAKDVRIALPTPFVKPIPGASKPASAPVAPLAAVGGAGVLEMPSAVAPARKGRMSAKEMSKIERAKMVERVKAFAETKPSQKDVMEYIKSRIVELAD